MLFLEKQCKIKGNRDFKLVTSDNRRSILVSEQNYHTSKYISEDLMIIEIKRV